MGGDKFKGSFLMLKMDSMGDPQLRVRLHSRRVHKWAGNLFPDDCEILFRFVLFCLFFRLFLNSFSSPFLSCWFCHLVLHFFSVPDVAFLSCLLILVLSCICYVMHVFTLFVLLFLTLFGACYLLFHVLFFFSVNVFLILFGGCFVLCFCTCFLSIFSFVCSVLCHVFCASFLCLVLLARRGLALDGFYVVVYGRCRMSVKRWFMLLTAVRCTYENAQTLVFFMLTRSTLA